MITIKQIQNNATVTDGSNTITLGAGDSYTCSIPNPPSGIAYQRPLPTGQTISYRTGDDAWQLVNNPYNEPPSNPLYCQSLVDFYTLKYDNAFGNKSRFTEDDGTPAPDYKQNFTNPTYLIDNLTGLAFYNGFVSINNKTWDNAIDECNSLNVLGYEDWYLPNINEFSILYDLSGNFFNFVLFSALGGRESWLSNTELGDSTRAHSSNSESFGQLIISRAKTKSNNNYIPIRKHF